MVQIARMERIRISIGQVKQLMIAWNGVVTTGVARGKK